MKLEKIFISGFRSIDSVTLSECGGFNVIIGKNNAGKSTILYAIDAFFECLKAEGAVSISPPHRDKVDHYCREVLRPIEFTFHFHLTLAERDAIMQDTTSEAPRLKHVVEGIHSDLMLVATIVITPLPDSFAHVRSIILRKYDEQDTPDSPSNARTILGISDVSAKELAERAKRAFRCKKEADYIDETAGTLSDRTEGEVWTRLKNDLSERRRLRYPFLSRSTEPPSIEIQDKLGELIAISESLSDLKVKAQVLSASLREEAEKLNTAPLKNQIESLSGMESSIPGYALNLLGRLASVNVLYLKERREPIGKKEAERILELKIERGGEQTLDRIKETVSGLLGVKIDAFRSKSQKPRSESETELDVDDFLVQVNGAGIREALRLILDYEFTRPDILLVEEPEIHLHPALETNMMRYLKRIGAECQIFITTHSTNFLDTAEMRNVYLASRKGSTQIQLLDVAEAEASIPQELGIRLSSLFMFDRLVFVEGPSDEQILREFAATLEVNLSQQSVGFVTMGGVRNLAHFAAEQTLAFLMKRQVSMWFIMDRDERDDEDVQRLERHLAEKARLVVLEKREIENYLLVPRALVEFIQTKQSLANLKGQPSPTTNLVEQSISECADNMKEVAVERRVVKCAFSPVYPNRNAVLNSTDGKNFTVRITEELSAQKDKLDQMISGMEKLIQEQGAIVNARWDNHKTDLIPGDLLLDNVCKQFGVRFIKERDSSRLAALLRSNEISSDIQGIIKDIGT